MSARSSRMLVGVSTRAMSGSGAAPTDLRREVPAGARSVVIIAATESQMAEGSVAASGTLEIGVGMIAGIHIDEAT